MLLQLVFVVLFGSELKCDELSFNYKPEIFRCHKDFCKTVKCVEIEDCPKGEIASFSSFCGCCKMCTKIPENPQADCLKLKRYRKQIVETEEVYSDHIWFPECDIFGTFAAKQQKKKKSICVNTFGENIFGQALSGFAENMTCGCSRYMVELQRNNPNTFMAKPQEHCSSSGDFADLQCIDDLCYCADTVTGEVIGRIVKMKFMDKLPCYNQEVHDSVYLKPCETELQRSRALRYGFFLKGIKVWGLEQFTCDPDGTFSPKQCDSETCACVNKDGTRIGSFQMEVGNEKLLNINMTCNCARDTKGKDSNFQYPTTRCEGYGNYKLFQCFHGDQCFCVDEDGDTISKQLNKTDESFCQNILREISGKSRNIISTTIIPTTSNISESTTPDYDYEDEE